MISVICTSLLRVPMSPIFFICVLKPKLNGRKSEVKKLAWLFLTWMGKRRKLNWTCQRKRERKRRRRKFQIHCPIRRKESFQGSKIFRGRGEKYSVPISFPPLAPPTRLPILFSTTSLLLNSSGVYIYKVGRNGRWRGKGFAQTPSSNSSRYQPQGRRRRRKARTCLTQSHLYLLFSPLFFSHPLLFPLNLLLLTVAKGGGKKKKSWIGAARKER